MTDVLRELQEMSFRGVEYPVVKVIHKFDQDAQRHKISFRDGEFVEMVGKRNMGFTYTIPMREDIASGPYENLFTVGLVKLFSAMRDRTPGPLVDPVFGEFQAVPVSYSDTLDPNKRDGTDVEIELVEYLEIGQETELVGGVQSLSSMASDSGALDAEVEKVFVAAQEPSPEPATSILNAVAGIGAQLNRNKQRVTSSLANYSNQLEKVEKQLVELEDPLNGDLIRETRRLRLNAERLKDRAEPTRAVKRLAINVAKSVAALAKELGLTLSDLLELNPRLAKSPTVPSGTEISYYAD